MEKIFEDYYKKLTDIYKANEFLNTSLFMVILGQSYVKP